MFVRRRASVSSRKHEVLVTLREGESTHTIFGVLPDARRWLYTSTGRLLEGGPDGSERRVVSDRASRAILHAPWILDPTRTSGHVLFAPDTTLYAQAFDGLAGNVVGTPVPILDGVPPMPLALSQPFSAGGSLLAYVGVTSPTRPVWIDREGRRLDAPRSLSGLLRDVRLSPRGDSLIASRYNPGSSGFELLLLDMARDTVSVLTKNGTTVGASWNADGSTIVAGSIVPGRGFEIHRLTATEGASLEPLVQEAGLQAAALSRQSRWA